MAISRILLERTPMICYECQQAGKRRDASALCHHCSAALCQEHALVLADPVTAQYPICKTVILPLRARVFLCSTCKDALQQTIESSRIASVEHEVLAVVAERDGVTV
jgi:hypothetical protein